MEHSPRTVRPRAIAVTLLLYAAFIVYQSLAGGGAWVCQGPVLALGDQISRIDLLANFVAYVPLGVLVVLATTGRHVPPARSVLHRGLVGLACIAALSACLEALQACEAERVSSTYDWAANVAGGLLGIVAGTTLRSWASMAAARGRAAAGSEHRLRLATMLVAVGWVAVQTAPWVFSVDVGRIRANVSFLRHLSDVPPLDWWGLARHAGAWLAVTCACRLVARGPWRVLAATVVAAAVSVCLQVLLASPAPLSFEELVAMAATIAILLPLACGAGSRPNPRPWAAGLLLGASITVAAYELQPGPAELGTRAFTWWPGVGLGGMLGAIDYALLFAWYGLCAVVAGRWAGAAGMPVARRWLPAVAILAALAFELWQVRIPGRGPDASGPVFTALAVLAATALANDGADIPDA